MSAIGEVAEGVPTAKALYKIAQDKELYLPIAKEVYEMLQGKEPKVSVQDLLQ